MPWRRLYALACLMAWNALKFFISSVIGIARILLTKNREIKKSKNTSKFFFLNREIVKLLKL